MIICAVGDSLTAATGGPAGLGWPGFIAARLAEEFSGLTVYNLGVRGDASTKVAGRWKNEVAYRSMADTPMALIFSVGTADCVQGVPQKETLTAVRTMLTESKEFGKAALIGPCPVADEEKSAQCKELSDAFATLCEELNIPYLPVYDFVVGSPIYKADLEQGDGIHPKTPGYSQIAQAVLEWDGLNTILNK
ncbi:MAG: GDSL-type esterase/lipase family protein [Desulfovibrio sp.]